MTEQNRSERLRVSKRRNIRWGRVIGTGIVVVLLALVGVVGFASMRTKTVVDKTYQDAGMKKSRDVSATIRDGKPFSVLLMGTDTGELGRNDKGRTDSLMIMTINPQKEETTIMSIPRDTLVAVPGYEDTFPQKINAAYELGSAKTAIKTVQDWLNIPIDYYALVNMGGLEQIVDEIGGVKVKSPLTFDYNPDTAHATPGNLYSFVKDSSTFTHTGEDGKTKTYTEMDGKAALAFSRMRYDDPRGDYGRQQRQRLVLETVVDKAKANPTKLLTDGFMTSLSKSVKTDLTFGDMTTIGTKYLNATKNIKSDYIQGQGYDLASGSTEVVSRQEEQRATNVLRRSLNLDAAETGNLYAGKISDEDVAAIGVPTMAASTGTVTQAQ